MSKYEVAKKTAIEAWRDCLKCLNNDKFNKVLVSLKAKSKETAV